MKFDYLYKIQKESSIEIEDIGNCALDVFNDLGFEWLLLVRTIDGMTHIVEFGPIVANLEYLPANVSYTYNRFEYSDSKIYKRIEKFLADGYRNITQAFEIEQKEAKEKMKNLVDCIDVCE